MKTMIECERNQTYRSDDGFSMHRTLGTIHHNDWQLVDSNGKMVDIGKQRLDLADRNKLDLIHLE